MLVDMGENETKEDGAKHEKELQKEVTKRVVNWKAVEQLQMLTFSKRWETISSITGRNAVNDIFEQFPYLEHEKVVRKQYCLQYCELHPCSSQTCTTLKLILTNVKNKDQPCDRQTAYRIKCTDCQATYIGETGRNLKTRLTEHKQAKQYCPAHYWVF